MPQLGKIWSNGLWNVDVWNAAIWAQSENQLFPIKRTVTWDGEETPLLVIGDPFWHRLTLNSIGSDFDFSSASAVSAALVADDHAEAFSGNHQQQISMSGADWGNGILSLYLPADVTEAARSFVRGKTLAKVEIQAVLSGNQFSWFAPVYLVPGYID